MKIKRSYVVYFLILFSVIMCGLHCESFVVRLEQRKMNKYLAKNAVIKEYMIGPNPLDRMFAPIPGRDGEFCYVISKNNHPFKDEIMKLLTNPVPDAYRNLAENYREIMNLRNIPDLGLESIRFCNDPMIPPASSFIMTKPMKDGYLS
jgi:hypothetical protein